MIKVRLDQKILEAVREMGSPPNIQRQFSNMMECSLRYAFWKYKQGLGPECELGGRWQEWNKPSGVAGPEQQAVAAGPFTRVRARLPDDMREQAPAASKLTKREGISAKPDWWREQFRSYWACLASAADLIGDHAEEYGSEEAKEFVRNMAIQAIDFAAGLTEPRSVEPKALTTCPLPATSDPDEQVVQSVSS